MNLVVDTNILILFFRQNPVYNIISNSKSLNLKLFIPQYAIDELERNINDIINYSKKREEEIKELIIKLKQHLIIIEAEKFKSFEDKVKKLAPHEKDIPFFALALYLNAYIWSNELAFKDQSEIKILRTRDLIEII